MAEHDRFVDLEVFIEAEEGRIDFHYSTPPHRVPNEEKEWLARLHAIRAGWRTAQGIEDYITWGNRLMTVEEMIKSGRGIREMDQHQVPNSLDVLGR